MNGGAEYGVVMGRLQSMQDDEGPAYFLHDKILNTQDYGIPHNRPRIYIVGIRRDASTLRFVFPRPTKRAHIEDILDPKVGEVTMQDKPTS